MNKLQQLDSYLEQHPELLVPIVIALSIVLCTTIYLTSLLFPKTVYNQYYTEGVPVVNCKHYQNIPDLNDPTYKSRIVGRISSGYCPESDYDIAIGNDIAKLYDRIEYLEKEVRRLQGDK